MANHQPMTFYKRLRVHPRRTALIAITFSSLILLFTYLNSERLALSYRHSWRHSSRPIINQYIDDLASLPNAFELSSQDSIGHNLGNITGEVEVSTPANVDFIFEAIQALSTAGRPHCELTPEHRTRYESLNATNGQDTIFLALNLHDTARVLPSFIHSLYDFLSFVGPHRVHVSVYENGSKDATPILMRLLARVLDELGTSYALIAKGNEGKVADWKMKHKGARIPILAEVRNHALDSLYNGKVQATEVLFMNDIVWCPADALEVLLQKERQGAEMVCSVDWDSGVVYDRWVIRAISGRGFYRISDLKTFYHSLFRWLSRPIPDFLREDPVSHKRFSQNLPLQVFSCWNGMAAISAKVFMPPYKVRFRTARNDLKEKGLRTDKESECFLICVDLWRKGLGKVAAVRRASVAYDLSEYESVRQDRTIQGVTSIEEERISWEPDPPRAIAYHDWAKWENERWGAWDEA